ncbi:MAG: 50S ribosomal protein L11 methyltransferase [Chloroflexi bacterium]|nr:50S ribosomal protein L11 methyltransferase [Chloroflexota bacterium]
MAAAVRVGGRLLASGIFIDREAEVSEALAAAGFRSVGRSVETEWVAIAAQRRAVEET